MILKLKLTFSIENSVQKYVIFSVVILFVSMIIIIIFIFIMTGHNFNYHIHAIEFSLSNHIDSNIRNVEIIPFFQNKKNKKQVARVSPLEDGERKKKK